MSPYHPKLIVAAFALVVCCLGVHVEGQGQTGGREAPVPERAQSLHAKGIAAGKAGNYQEAIALLTEAAALAPDWPAAIYHRGYTHLAAKNPTAALADFAKTLELAPRGFFAAHVAVDTLRREQKGELPAGLYLAYATLEVMPNEQRRQMIAQLVERVPNFAPGWLEFSRLADKPEERLKRLLAGLGAQPDPETRGMLKLNQAIALRQLGQRDPANAILREVVTDQTSPLAVEVLAKKLLSE